MAGSASLFIPKLERRTLGNHVADAVCSKIGRSDFQLYSQGLHGIVYAVDNVLVRPGYVLPHVASGDARMADLIGVFRATGTRKPQGSPTDFNRQIRDTVGEMPLAAQAVTAAKTGGASLLTQAGDAARRAWLGRNNASLAELLTAPDSVVRIGAIVRKGSATPFADALARQLMQEREAR